MKKAFTISLAFLLLLLSVRDLVTFAAFKFQQDTIAAKLCVNKYEPIPMCAGQCFLDQQIEENRAQNSDPFAGASFELAEKSVYFQSVSYLKVNIHSDRNLLLNFHYSYPYSDSFVVGPFHPPKFTS